MLDEQCSIALHIGMTWDLYWYGRIDAYYIFVKKENEVMKQKELELDSTAWLTGLYVEKAVGSVLKAMFSKGSTASTYLKQPILSHQKVTETETRKNERQKIIDKINEHNFAISVKQKQKG